MDDRRHANFAAEGIYPPSRDRRLPEKSVWLSRSPRRPVRNAWSFPPERVKALPCFYASRKVDFQGSRPAQGRDPMTRRGGILVRELDECPGYGELIDHHSTDSRENPGSAEFRFAETLRFVLRESRRLRRAREVCATLLFNLTTLLVVVVPLKSSRRGRRPLT